MDIKVKEEEEEVCKDTGHKQQIQMIMYITLVILMVVELKYVKYLQDQFLLVQIYFPKIMFVRVNF